LRDLRTRLWTAEVRFAVAAFLIGRAAVSVLAVLGWQLPHDRPEPATYWAPQPPEHDLFAAFTGLEHYDAGWYLQIASHGYEPGDPSGAFFPLYPLLVRVVGLALGGHWLAGAVVVSNVALLLSLVLLQHLTARELAPQFARPVVVLLLCSPMAFFLYAPYSESLFLALSLACLMLVRSGRWPAAGAAAALASATRSTGLALGAAMAVEAVHQAGWRVRSREQLTRLARTLPWAALSVGGILAYFLYWQGKGDWHEPTRLLTTAFGREHSTPWATLWHGGHQLVSTFTQSEWLPFNLESLLGFIALGLAVVVLRRYPPAYSAFVLVGMVMPLLLVIPARPLTSIARYDLPLFPLFWALAEVTQRRGARTATLVVSSLLLALSTLLFAAWHDVL
jgi:hypothetical protein